MTDHPEPTHGQRLVFKGIEALFEAGHTAFMVYMLSLSPDDLAQMVEAYEAYGQDLEGKMIMVEDFFRDKFGDTPETRKMIKHQVDLQHFAESRPIPEGAGFRGGGWLNTFQGRVVVIRFGVVRRLEDMYPHAVSYN